MYLKHDFGLEQEGGAAALTLAPSFPLRRAPVPETRFARLRELDLLVDLGSQIGARTWWRGAATCLALCAATFMLAPSLDAMPGRTPPPLTDAGWDEARAQAITPLAYGADTGRRMAATDAVEPLADTPERPRVEMTATLGRGDSFARVLERTGVARAEAADLEARVAGYVALSEVASGTPMEIVLGRRPNRTVPRPIESLSFRARFDMRMEVARVDGGLAVTPVSIAVDNTPLRIRGRVGSSLYQSARAAGAPPRAIQEYLRAIGTQLSVAGDVRGDDTFDLIIEHRRAETGEVEIGQLLYAGLVQSNREVQLLKWSAGGPAQWFEASGVGRQTGEMMMPVSGRQTSPFGYRVHPILGYRRLHTGIDFGAPYGAPIRAAASGTIDFAGRNRGYGNFVRISHGSGMQTAYGHMSRIAVSHGERVSQGEVIGYVGSTGMSTGPHLHYELIRNGQKINPRSVTFIQQAQLSGDELRRFRSTLTSLRNVRPGATMARRDERGARRDRTASAERRPQPRG